MSINTLFFFRQQVVKNYARGLLFIGFVVGFVVGTLVTMAATS